MCIFSPLRARLDEHPGYSCTEKIGNVTIIDWESIIHDTVEKIALDFTSSILVLPFTKCHSSINKYWCVKERRVMLGSLLEGNIGFPFGIQPLKIRFPTLFLAFRQCYWVSRKPSNFAPWLHTADSGHLP